MVSYKTFNEIDYWKDIRQSCLTALNPTGSQTFKQWVFNGPEPLMMGSQQLTLSGGHEYLQLLYEDECHYIVAQKSTQCGASTWATTKVPWKCGIEGKNVAYVNPGSAYSDAFVQGVLNALIDANEKIRRMVKVTDSVSLKKFNDGYGYFRGGNVRIAGMSFPASCLFIDETDLMKDISMLQVFKARLNHEKNPEEIYISNPSVPGWGISKLYNETDKKRWMLRCPSCSAWNDVLEAFPECLKESSDGLVYLGCSHCEKQLDGSQGEWVAEVPSLTKDKSGYLISHLYSSFARHAEILTEYRQSTNLTNFFNLTLGLPYLSAQDVLTESTVIACCDPERPMQTESLLPSYMGIDVGARLLYVTVLVKENNVQCGRVIYLGAVTEFGQVEALFNRFNVVKAVIDGMPETRASRQLAKDFPGRCWLSFFSEHQKAGPRWTRENSQVLSNRTEMCDRVHHEISSKRLVLPRLNESVSLLARHCCNVIKKVETNEITGAHSYTYVNIGPDHAHFSLLYAILASDHDRGFEDVDLS